MSSYPPARLTETLVSRLKFPSGSNQKFATQFDTEVRGLHVRTYQSGRRAYWLKYSLGRKQRYKELGPATRGQLEKARERAGEISGAARRGMDLVASERREANRKTIADLVPTYLEARKGTLRDTSLELLSYYLNDSWKNLHSRFVDEVRRPDVVAELDKLERTSGKVSADRARSALATFFDWCLDRGFTESNPVVRIKNRASSGGRERVLSAAELRAVWKACEALDAEALDRQRTQELPQRGHAYSRIVRLLVLTGQRRDEVGGLCRSEVNEAERRLELPAERTKNGRPHFVPLVRAAWGLLTQGWPKGFVFGRFEGSNAGFGGWSKAKAELDARITKARDGKPLPHWTVHDLRRTFVTGWAEYKIADDALAELTINHVSGTRRGVRGTYDRSQRLEERRAALERWAAWVERTVRG
jgi:integrase